MNFRVRDLDAMVEQPGGCGDRGGGARRGLPERQVRRARRARGHPNPCGSPPSPAASDGDRVDGQGVAGAGDDAGEHRGAVAAWTGELRSSAFPSVFEAYYSALGRSVPAGHRRARGPWPRRAGRGRRDPGHRAPGRAERDCRDLALHGGGCCDGGRTTCTSCSSWAVIPPTAGSSSTTNISSLFLALEGLGISAVRRPSGGPRARPHRAGAAATAARARSYPTSLATVIEGAATADQSGAPPRADRQTTSG